MKDARLADLDTPAAVVDLQRVHRNLGRVSAYCREHGLDWRPHVKTHKTPEIAVSQMQAGACGLTVASVGEAEVMAAVAKDLLLAYPPIGRHKRRRLTQLMRTGIRLTVGLDSEEALETVSAAARAAGATASALIEIDLGMRRTGVPDAAAAVALARRLEVDSFVEYAGVMFYPGHIRLLAEGDADGLIEGLSERLGTVLSALHEAGLPPRIVSGGSTPTLWHSHRVRGLTEVRPGTNVFHDRNSVVAGAASWEECAYSVLATVVSTAVPGQAVIDAGSKSLASEAAAGGLEGFGVLLDRPDVIVRALSEEHGILDLSATDWRPALGDRVRVIPNHVCISVNLQERLWIVGRGGEGIEEWVVAARSR